MDRPFTDIVVPLDGSPAAERALGPALQLVCRTGAPLRVLSRVLADDKEELTTYLAGIADRHAAITDVETEVVDHESIPTRSWRASDQAASCACHRMAGAG